MFEITNLESLDYQGFRAASEDDRETLEVMLGNDIPLFANLRTGRVYSGSELGCWVADLIAC